MCVCCVVLYCYENAKKRHRPHVYVGIAHQQPCPFQTQEQKTKTKDKGILLNQTCNPIFSSSEHDQRANAIHMRTSRPHHPLLRRLLLRALAGFLVEVHLAEHDDARWIVGAPARRRDCGPGARGEAFARGLCGCLLALGRGGCGALREKREDGAWAAAAGEEAVEERGLG